MMRIDEYIYFYLMFSWENYVTPFSYSIGKLYRSEDKSSPVTPFFFARLFPQPFSFSKIKCCYWIDTNLPYKQHKFIVAFWYTKLKMGWLKITYLLYYNFYFKYTIKLCIKLFIFELTIKNVKVCQTIV